MSPIPACSKPPLPQLALLINPLPDPLDKNNHMIYPQFYEDKPGSFNPEDSQKEDKTLILQKNPKNPPDQTDNTPKQTMKYSGVSSRKTKRNRKNDKTMAIRLDCLKN
ncbi:hypothetical protein O181_054212 [Austropuccinia psidii MF-1]|uniref:Uncharacterized protein n=1 Tax=Austropuccinia psidii MF-1 TaxID=1389203 RepID=A0A9Q3HSA8_9BASI|nr:hypothetical protein [Austropuccinia psidii MF-1]